MADQWSEAADSKYKELRGRIFKAASGMGSEDPSAASHSLAVVPPLSLSSVAAEEQGTVTSFKGKSLPSAKAPSQLAFCTDSPRRLGQLSARIHGLENDWMKESQSRSNSFDRHLRVFEDTISRPHVVKEERMKAVVKDVDHLRMRVDKDLKEYMNDFDGRTTNTMTQLKESVSLDLALEKQYLRDLEAKVDKQIASNVVVLRDAIRSFAPPQDFKKVQDLITYANDMLAQERKNREDAVASTDEKVMEQMCRLQELIEAERSAREDLGVQLEAIDMHEMFLQFQIEIERERRVFEERLEGTKRKVLAEMQVTLGKIEGECTARKEQHVELGTAIDSECSKFGELLEGFKRAGAVSESAFIKILEDVTYAIQRKVMVRKTGLRGPVNKR
eukprot:TRINITY_DN1028_c0_g2_i1.p1 TRINITY_DN1028_c0_g2~~TRINITY_DN1028_c0_g2_i1.p1  ORF type:complete len:389 (+),score=114.31 TRINITY_DN1028_c0_g2_i1:175-1341(+)